MYCLLLLFLELFSYFILKVGCEKSPHSLEQVHILGYKQQRLFCVTPCMWMKPQERDLSNNPRNWASFTPGAALLSRGSVFIIEHQSGVIKSELLSRQYHEAYGMPLRFSSLRVNHGWLTPLVPALVSQRQADKCEFEGQPGLPIKLSSCSPM